MIQPIEMKQTRSMRLHRGVVSTTSDVWSMLVASRNGDLKRVKELAEHCPALLTCQYDYTAPLHLAVREGHLDVARYLVEQGALDPPRRSRPRANRKLASQFTWSMRSTTAAWSSHRREFPSSLVIQLRPCLSGFMPANLIS